ncbi:MAG TPA: hypothetical protein VFX29_07840, partial [Longimicrobiaceae bacterium]|nr:hypothetical protein [Longimicrobiaceae bacterium]
MIARRAVRRLRSAAAGFVLAAALGACASGLKLPPRPAPHTLPAGSPLASRTLGDGDAWLRHYLMVGEYDAALELIERSKALPGDKLLRRLQAGVVLHEAGRYEESNAAFEWAEREADLRYTRSVSRAAASILVNDRVLAYLPTPAERAAIPYYRMLNYLALGELDAAAVEARKAGVLTTGATADEPKCDASGFLGYFSGLVYGAARETNDALVAFRRAERIYGACAEDGGAAAPAPLRADLVRAARALGLVEELELAAGDSALPLALPADNAAAAGDVIVVVEHGFAAH